MSVRKALATPSVNLRKYGYEKHTYVETRRNYVIFKTRRTSKSLEQILKSIEELAQPGTNIKGCSYYNADGLWGDVCKSLEVPNTSVNRQKLYKTAAHLRKVFSHLSNDLMTT